jgi:hypothetical protein
MEMRQIITSFIAISVLFLSYGISNAQELLVTADDVCVQGTGSTNARLYRVNPNTASFQEIGPIGFDGVGALAQIGDGRLVAGARADANGEKIFILIEINPNTGQGSLIGVSGSGSGPGCGRITDLTYDPATDTLYALGIQCASNSDFSPNLLTINPNTGEGTIIGQTGFNNLGGNALAIDSNGNLFSSAGCPNTNYSINPDTGVGTFLSNIPGLCNAIFNSATFSPFTGELLGTYNFFPLTELAVLDPFTGNVTSIGQLPNCADGIAFVELPPRDIPTLSEWGFIVMAGILGIAALLVIRRRRIAA